MLTGNDAPFELTADVTDVETLRLVADEATNGKNYDHADWGDAKLTCSDEEPEEPVVVDAWQLDGPKESPLDAELTLDSAGRVALDVTGDTGATVVSATRLGLVGSDGDFRSGLSFVDRTDAKVKDAKDAKGKDEAPKGKDATRPDAKSKTDAALKEEKARTDAAKDKPVDGGKPVTPASPDSKTPTTPTPKTRSNTASTLRSCSARSNALSRSARLNTAVTSGSASSSGLKSRRSWKARIALRWTHS